METFKAVVDTLAQPKVAIMIGVLAMVIGGGVKNEELCVSGLVIVGLAFLWGFAKAIRDINP